MADDVPYTTVVRNVGAHRMEIDLPRVGAVWRWSCPSGVACSMFRAFPAESSACSLASHTGHSALADKGLAARYAHSQVHAADANLRTDNDNSTLVVSPTQRIAAELISRVVVLTLYRLRYDILRLPRVRRISLTLRNR